MSLTKRLTMFLLAVFTVFIIQVQLTRADDTTPQQVVVVQQPPLRRPMVQTPMTRGELMNALREGHIRVFGKPASKNRLAMAWGQVAFENGHGKLTFNHNLGNVGPTAADQPRYYNRGDGHFYRHHDDFVSGAAAYWEVIKRCSAALARFDTGNPTEAAMYLKRCGYFEADLVVYTRGFSSLYYFAHSKVFTEEENERQEREKQAAIRAAIRELATSARSPDDALDAGIPCGGNN
jgi:hypothetical protein